MTISPQQRQSGARKAKQTRADAIRSNSALQHNLTWHTLSCRDATGDGSTTRNLAFGKDLCTCSSSCLWHVQSTSRNPRTKTTTGWRCGMLLIGPFTSHSQRTATPRRPIRITQLNPQQRSNPVGSGSTGPSSKLSGIQLTNAKTNQRHQAPSNNLAVQLLSPL